MLALALAVLMQTRTPAPPPAPTPYEERVKVERVVITGRVIDRFGNVIPNLGANDFRLRVDGLDTPIESIEWIPSRDDGKAEAVPAVAREGESSNVPRFHPPGRMVVMLFQWEIAGQKDDGFMRVMQLAIKMARSTDRDDRIAVFAFGSSLHLLQDFTTDREAVVDAIKKIRLLSLKRAADPGGPELTPAFERCGSVDSIEEAFVCVGSSLQRHPGPKSLLFFGWTIRTWKGSGHSNYPRMLEAITKADTSVFALDVSDGIHKLAVDVSWLARETGGFWSPTHEFPDLARIRVQRTLRGSYEIVFKSPGGPRGWHEVDIEVVGAGTALFRRWYQD
jgi:VWFA-related protein